MPRKKTEVLRKLTRSHLEAIGRVAATWSQLETVLLDSMSYISGANIFNTIVFAAPAQFMSWIDMLIIQTRSSANHKEKEKVLEKICSLLKKLYGLRNTIVHATWTLPTAQNALIGSAMQPIIITPHDKAKGIGIPKRGRDVVVTLELTPKQMRKVATLIEEAQSMLYEIVHRKPPKSPGERLIHTLTDQTILQRIQKMLDTLPNPSRGSSKP